MVVKSVVQSVIKPVGVKVVNPFVVFKASPLNIVKSGPCQIWFDGQDEDTFSLNGNKVIQWDDKSGFDRHVANAVDAQRPTWDPVTGRVTFNSAAQTYLRSAAFDAPLAQPNTIFILYKITGDLARDQNPFDGITMYFNSFWNVLSTFRLYSGVSLIDGATNVNDNIHCGEFNKVTSNYWINGTLVAGPENVGSNDLDGITLGARGDINRHADIEICEVFGYNCSLTEAERNRCENYLIKKWGLPY